MERPSPEKPMPPSAEADIDGFLRWVDHTQGRPVAERCRQIFDTQPAAHSTPLQVLAQARSEVYQDDLQALAALKKTPVSSAVNVHPTGPKKTS
jgi:hypothetical protein